MTNHRGSTTARPVSGASEQLFNLTQGHIRPLIGLIERLNEIGAEDELRVIAAQLPAKTKLAETKPADLWEQTKAWADKNRTISGALLGGAAGTIVPGIGTVIGTIVGAGIGFASSRERNVPVSGG